LAVAVGVTLLVPITFAAYLIYDMPLLAIVCAGLGVPLVLAGASKWIHEGATQKAAISGVADIGIGIFIISEILIFVSLFASYWTMRIASGAAGEVWPPEGTPHINLILPLIMTVVLVASSITYHLGEIENEKGNKGGLKKWLVVSILLGSVFLGFTIYEYVHLFEEGFTPGRNSYATAFYSLTGFHASHVLIGILVFVMMLFSVMWGQISDMFVKVAGIYWHFVDVVWLFVASQVYYW